jgi:hypothetical protein
MKSVFTEEEDNIIKEFVAKNGEKKWNRLENIFIR